MPETTGKKRSNTNKKIILCLLMAYVSAVLIGCSGKPSIFGGSASINIQLPNADFVDTDIKSALLRTGRYVNLDSKKQISLTRIMFYGTSMPTCDADPLKGTIDLYSDSNSIFPIEQARVLTIQQQNTLGANMEIPRTEIFAAVNIDQPSGSIVSAKSGGLEISFWSPSKLTATFGIALTNGSVMSGTFDAPNCDSP